MRERRVEVAPGVSLHVAERPGEEAEHPGGGLAFLLVHGLASNLRLWDGVAAGLAAHGRHVVAVDLRGHGRSDKPDTGYDVGTVAADLAALIDRLGLDRPWVVGQSWGANVVLELAWIRPESVGCVACVDGGWIELADRFEDWEACLGHLAPPRLAGMRAEAVERQLRITHPDWPEAGIQGTLACFEVRADGTVAPWLTAERHLAVLRGLWHHRPSTRYPELRAPVLLIPAHRPGCGEEGETGPAVARAELGLTSSRTVWLEGDHDLHAHRPDEVVGALLAAEQEQS